MRGALPSMPTAAATVLVACGLAVSGCSASSGAPAAAANDKPLPSVPAIDARTRLAGLAALAQDRHFQAAYTYTPPGQPARTVTVVLAADGGWQITVPGGALGGQVDVAVAGDAKGLYQCRLSGSHPSCVKIAGADGTFPADVDPGVEHPFTDWLDEFTDRDAALSVAATPAPSGVKGTCFSVEGNSAALATPVDPGTYCLDDDGTLTAVRAGFGALLLAAAPALAPPTLTLPGPVTGGAPLTTAALPAPSASASADAARRRTPPKPALARPKVSPRPTAHRRPARGNG